MSLQSGSYSSATGADAVIRDAEAALEAEDLDVALALLYRAEELGVEPDRCAGNRWLAYMLLGDFHAAWREGDAIRERGAPDPHRFWNGEGIRGTRLMLRSLHGFGDAVQMFRFLPRLRQLAAHLVVEVPPRIVEIAPHFEGMGEVITWGADAPSEPPAWDVQAEVMELPFLLRVGSDDLEPQHGYLRIPDEVRRQTAQVMGPKRRPRVGVVWTAGHWNPTRSIPAHLLAGLAALEAFEFWSLQGGYERQASPALPGAGWRDVYECGDGILRLAAVIEQMDLVITVDTLAAHLAGVLNVPCWVLLQHRADWRWMCGRTSSPWYPSLRLWRSAAAGDWSQLVAQVTQELSGWDPGESSEETGLRAGGK